MLQQKKKPKLLFLVTEDYYFWSHRLPIARAARDADFEVHVATHVVNYGNSILNEGFILHRTRFARSNRNLWCQVRALYELINLFRNIKPDIVHNVALKAIVFGSIAAAVVRVPRVINLVAGLGVVFTSREKKYRLASVIARVLARVLLSSKHVVVMVQNQDDLHEILRMAPRAKVKLIRGSGVDTNQYFPTLEPVGNIRVTLVGRMLFHKGIFEFVEAAQILKDFGFVMQLVGGIDTQNSSGITELQLKAWLLEGHVSWLGHQTNIADIWKNSHIAVLPSYREGLPKSLLEAAACGRPIIAADTPGCREVVKQGYNGFLVPAKDSQALANAILCLGLDPVLRAEMGKKSREMVLDYFCQHKIAAQTLRLYWNAI